MRPPATTLALLLLAACAAPVPPTRTEEPHTAHPTADPTEPGASGTPHPSVPEGADGSIVLFTEFALGGSGVSVVDALAVASSRPVLVTGILLRDEAGGIWFCDALDPSAEPAQCASPSLWVTGFPEEQAVFDPANAGSTGMRTEDGVAWMGNQQLFGVVHPAR